jgi:hypothetical protein
MLIVHASKSSGERPLHSHWRSGKPGGTEYGFGGMFTRYQTVSPFPWFGQSSPQGSRTWTGAPGGAVSREVTRCIGTTLQAAVSAPGGAHILRTPHRPSGGMSGYEASEWMAQPCAPRTL